MRVAIVTSHPVQYYAPWFRYIARHSHVDIRVFYLWKFGVEATVDRSFGREIVWDVPLLDGYAYEFVNNVSSAPGTHHFSGLNNPELSARVRAFAPDAVLCIGYNALTFVRFVLGSRRMPILLRGDSHRLIDERTLSQRLKRRLIARWFRRFAGFLYVGAANLGYYKFHGVPERKLFFSPHAVDNARFAAADPVEATAFRDALDIPPDHRLVLFAGKFEHKKRPLDLLRAFKNVDPPNTTLLYVGDGILESELHAEAAGDRRIKFIGFQNQSTMPKIYAASDLFVLPSFGSSETWGLAVNEAMAVGRAVIVSSHVGCGPDLVRDKENGLTFPAGDVSALCATLRYSLESADLRAWGSASRRIVDTYDYAAATKGLMQALDSIKRR